jgi:hypothetical protein
MMMSLKYTKNKLEVLCVIPVNFLCNVHHHLNSKPTLTEVDYKENFTTNFHAV